MRLIKLIETLIFLCIANFISGQTPYAICDIRKVSSYNKQYFLRTIPNENEENTRNGSTIVYTSDSTILYRIPRYFRYPYYKQQLFLSNDGRNVAAVLNSDLDYTNFQQKCITIYKDGQPFKEYALHDLIACNSKRHEVCALFYSPDTIKIAAQFKEQITRKAIYQSNDTLLIFSKMGQIIKLNLTTGTFLIDKLSKLDTKVMSRYDTVQVKSFKVLKPTIRNEFPKMKNGKKTEEELADFLGMKIFKKKKPEKYKIYELHIFAHLDIEGNAHVVNIANYKFKGIPAKEKIYLFFSKNKFETINIPRGVDGWIFHIIVKLRNKNLKIAKEELEKETKEERDNYIKRTLADSLNGHYIPKNIEECFVELNKILEPETVDEIKKLKSRDETIRYHMMGHGLWLRNNWGLWGGSRLQVYLTNKGLNHPDDMSSLILEYYYDWLNGINQGWQEFDKKEKPKEPKK